jgi:hypothetical protein
VKLADISGTKRRNICKLKLRNFKPNSQIANVRDLHRSINDFKRGYQPRTNIVKDEKGNFITDPHSILARWRNHFSQLLNVHELMMLGRQKYIQQNL